MYIQRVCQSWWTSSSPWETISSSRLFTALTCCHCVVHTVQWWRRDKTKLVHHLNKPHHNLFQLLVLQLIRRKVFLWVHTMQSLYYLFNDVTVLSIECPCVLSLYHIYLVNATSLIVATLWLVASMHGNIMVINISFKKCHNHQNLATAFYK